MSLTRSVIKQIRASTHGFAVTAKNAGLTGFRLMCTGSTGSGEAHLANLLRKRFPGANDVQVVDVSGGCGSMYEVHIEAAEFKGLRMIQQHKLVTEALSEEIKAMHGLRISTSVPKS